MKNPLEKIEKTENILTSIWILISTLWKDFKNELIELYLVSKKSLLEWWYSKKIATIIILVMVFFPLIKTYGWYIYKWYEYYNYLKTYESVKEELSNSYELSVKSFFNTYNLKYWVDCNWIAKVNVDSNMYEKYWTTYKKNQNCALTSKMQIYPITVWNLVIDKEKKKVTVSWKALVLVLNWDNVSVLKYQNYNLWKMLDWDEKDLWKINPFWDTLEGFKN